MNDDDDESDPGRMDAEHQTLRNQANITRTRCLVYEPDGGVGLYTVRRGCWLGTADWREPHGDQLPQPKCR